MWANSSSDDIRLTLDEGIGLALPLMIVKAKRIIKICILLILYKFKEKTIKYKILGSYFDFVCEYDSSIKSRK